MLTTIDDAEYELTVAIDETLADMSPELEINRDDVAHDMAFSIAMNCDQATAYELCRRQFGVVPQQIKQWFGDSTPEDDEAW